ncbi:signal recognition particle SRP9 SRP14 subunit [Cyathus striatus]|nr:signal recognition particle SRP9 SRP14 subunit [Cyathus striatus]
MVYIHSWHDYQDAAEALYQKSPNQTRYCVKWKSNEGKLVLKITDNVSCIKFKTNSSIFLNRFEALNYSLMQKMQNRKPAPPPAAAAPVPAKTQMQVDSGRATPLPTASASTGGVKKKKPKRRSSGLFA